MRACPARITGEPVSGWYSYTKATTAAAPILLVDVDLLAVKFQLPVRLNATVPATRLSLPTTGVAIRKRIPLVLVC